MDAKGKTVQFDHETHLAVQLLLPWYVIRRLDSVERGRVDAHLADCARCRADLAWQRKLHATHIAPETSIEVEHALAASLARIGAVPRPRPGMPRRVAPRRIPWLQWLVGVQAALILALVLLLEPRFEMSLAPPAVAQANLLVAFHGTATAQQVQQALHASGAEIVLGPGDDGTYLLKTAPDRRAAALRQLRADAAIARVEPLRSPAR